MWILFIILGWIIYSYLQFRKKVQNIETLQTMMDYPDDDDNKKWTNILEHINNIKYSDPYVHDIYHTATNILYADPGYTRGIVSRNYNKQWMENFNPGDWDIAQPPQPRVTLGDTQNVHDRLVAIGISNLYKKIPKRTIDTNCIASIRDYIDTSDKFDYNTKYKASQVLNSITNMMPITNLDGHTELQILSNVWTYIGDNESIKEILVRQLADGINPMTKTPYCIMGRASRIIDSLTTFVDTDSKIVDINTVKKEIEPKKESIKEK